MKSMLHVALHDLRLQVVDRAAIFFMLIMPLGFVLFFGTVFRDGGGPESVTVLLPVVNEDGGFLSLALLEQLRSESFDVDVYSAAEADTTTFDTRVARVPPKFSLDIMQGKQAKVSLNSQANSSMTYDTAAAVKLHQAQVRFLGNLVRWNPTMLTEGQTIDQIDPVEKGRFLAMVTEEPNVTVQSTYAGTGRPVPSGMGQSIPGMLTMFVVMTVLIGGSEAITKEKTMGTLRRLVTTVLSPMEVVGGKLIGLMFLGLVQAAILVVITEGLSRGNVMGMDFLWSPHMVGLVPLLVAYTFAVGSLGILLSGLFRTTQQAESLAWLVGMVLSGLGGCWWPLEMMPGTVRMVANFFPTAWAMKGFHELITFGSGPMSVLPAVAVLTLMGVIFALLGARAMKGPALAN